MLAFGLSRQRVWLGSTIAAKVEWPFRPSTAWVQICKRCPLHRTGVDSEFLAKLRSLRSCLCPPLA